MVFQGEDKVLEENLIKKDRKFFPSLMEWVADGNAEQIIRHRTSGGIIFTVPAKTTLFLTTLFIDSEDNSGATSSASNIVILMPDDSVRFTLGSIVSSAAGIPFKVLSLTFPMPIKIDQLERIQATGTIPAAFSCGFTGFLLPKRIGERTFI